MMSLFGRGFRGLSDSLFSGLAGAVYRSVGIDSRTKPGILQAHQKLTKHSGTTIDTLCKFGLALSDNSRLWFSSTDGRIWREVAGVYTLLTTFVVNKWDTATYGFTGGKLDVTAQVSGVAAPLGFYAQIGLDTRFYVGEVGGSDIFEYFDTTGNTTYQLKDLEYDRTYSHNAQTAGNAVCYFMRPNATQWWVSTSTIIYQYTTGASGNISTSTYSGKSFNSVQANSIFFFALNSAGTKLYIGDNAGGNYVFYQYTLTIAYDIATATYDSVSFTLAVDLAQSATLTPDDDSIIVFGYAGSVPTLFQIKMATAGNLATASLVRGTPFLNGLINTNGVPALWTQIVPANAAENVSYRLFVGSDNTVTRTVRGGTSGTGDAIYEITLSDGTTGSTILSAAEFTTTFPKVFKEQFIFNNNLEFLPKCVLFTTEQHIFKIRLSDIATFENNVAPVATFGVGDDTYHPVVKQNNALYFGDKHEVIQINQTGSAEVAQLNVPIGEQIKALVPYDIDILIGTEIDDYGRVLRWDGFSPSWFAEDFVYETNGVEAFLQDDNFVYVVAGRKGSIYAYNGAKCEDFLTIADITGANEMRVYPHAVGFYKNTTIFGVSNSVGTPNLAGVYGYGAYNNNYAKTLSLDYPISTNNLGDIEIGALVIDGDDLYVSWKDGTTYGIDKIDVTAKYAGYMETMALTPAMNRHQIKTISDIIVPYHMLPANTGVTIAINKDYTTFGSNVVVIDDTLRKVVYADRPSITNTVNPRLRIGLTVSGNTTPEIEDVLFAIAPTGRK